MKRRREEEGLEEKKRKYTVYIKEVAVYAEVSSATRLGPSPSLAVAYLGARA